MVSMTSAEILLDVLRLLRDLTPLMNEKSLDKAIAGLSEAKAVVDNYKSIQVDIEATKALSAENQATKTKIALDLAELQSAQDALYANAAELKKKEKQLDETSAALEALAKNLANLQANLAEKQVSLDDLTAKTKSELQAAEVARAAAQERLAKLAEVV